MIPFVGFLVGGLIAFHATHPAGNLDKWLYGPFCCMLLFAVTWWLDVGDAYVPSEAKLIVYGAGFFYIFAAYIIAWRIHVNWMRRKSEDERNEKSEDERNED